MAVSLVILLACVFDLQYSILIGPFLDVLLLMGLTVIGMILSIVTIPLNGSKKLYSYLPLSLIIVAFSFTAAFPKLSLGHHIHYLMNKGNLEVIEKESTKANVYDLTDMLRYQKSLNDESLSNDLKYITKKEIENAFGGYIKKQNLNIDEIVDIQRRMIDSDIISLNRTDDYLILTVDGFVDNEYGYVKSFKKKLKVGDELPPYGFVIVRLIKFKDGWYFFYTT
ncbi:hypothetical protein [Prolixibacter denitrificans]|nr:hypothetical protein [Prolixibacter denitrificans]